MDVCDGHSSLGVICGSSVYPLLQDQQLLQLAWDVVWCQRLRFDHQHKKVGESILKSDRDVKGSIISNVVPEGLYIRFNIGQACTNEVTMNFQPCELKIN